MRVGVVLGAILAVSIASCGSGGVEGTVSQSEAAETYGACPDGGGAGDSVGSVELLASVERWLEVRSVTDQMRTYETNEAFENTDSATQELDLSVSEVKSAEGQGSESKVEKVTIHTSFIPGINATLDEGGRIFLGLASESVEREMVFFVLARPQGGGSYFPGRCQFESMTEPLQRLLGNRYEDALASIVGVTDREKIIELLSGEIPPQSAQPAILKPEDAGSELLDGLTKTSISFDVPASLELGS